ncbi:MAG: hypothetical protein CME64_11905 [Halobacteriovoraceae bacterium]|nr:hypothetical protein [Halobacteriovoraceae bacterium]|tara:strand:- start:128290 stop:130203 length:1914 start_codon:yes stop_codon:yes gene_type:complete
MKKQLIALLPFVILSSAYSVNALADRTYSYPATYPFVPMQLDLKKNDEPLKPTIYGDVRRVTEDKKFIKNFKDIISLRLMKAKTTEKPWTSSYWPMNKGMIADPYENSGLPYYADLGWVDWENNHKQFLDRLEEELPYVDDMTEEELEKLAPSEKYDLLLGDKTFELTRKLWEYSYKWGSEKENAFTEDIRKAIAGSNTLDLANEYLSKRFYTSVDDAFANSWTIKNTISAKRALELVSQGEYSNAKYAFPEALEYATQEAENYVLADKNSRMAAWEGICNGWATAAGLVPRPRKSFSIELPNGKKLKFYPADIKALAALYYVNSLIQDPARIGNDGLPYTQGTVSAGMRCNLKNVGRDIWGRRYDSKEDPFNSNTHRVRDARCVGVHPATWHLGLVNLIGKQGRSFVVERKVGAAVDNHPMWGYEMEFFHPNTGRSKDNIYENVVRINKKDQFFQFRHPKAEYIVGVKMVAKYMDYARPDREDTNSEDDDDVVNKKMYYDLELDKDYNIVGGQWRAYKKGYEAQQSSRDNRPNHNQPDFFWTITKDYKKTGWFGDVQMQEPWTDKTVAPPASWLKTARSYHGFVYNMTKANNNPATCHVVNLKTDKTEKWLCDQKYEKPQPFINVLNALIELSQED